MKCILKLELTLTTSDQHTRYIVSGKEINNLISVEIIFKFKRSVENSSRLYHSRKWNPVFHIIKYLSAYVRAWNAVYDITLKFPYLWHTLQSIINNENTQRLSLPIINALLLCSLMNTLNAWKLLSVKRILMIAALVLYYLWNTCAIKKIH